METILKQLYDKITEYPKSQQDFILGETFALGTSLILDEVKEEMNPVIEPVEEEVQEDPIVVVEEVVPSVSRRRQMNKALNELKFTFTVEQLAKMSEEELERVTKVQALPIDEYQKLTKKDPIKQPKQAPIDNIVLVQKCLGILA